MPGGAGSLCVRLAFDAEFAESVSCRISAGGLRLCSVEVGTAYVKLLEARDCSCVLCCMAKTIILYSNETNSCSCDEQR